MPESVTQPAYLSAREAVSVCQEWQADPLAARGRTRQPHQARAGLQVAWTRLACGIQSSMEKKTRIACRLAPNGHGATGGAGGITSTTPRRCGCQRRGPTIRYFAANPRHTFIRRVMQADSDPRLLRANLRNVWEIDEPKQRGHDRPHQGFEDQWDGMTKAEQHSQRGQPPQRLENPRPCLQAALTSPPSRRRWSSRASRLAPRSMVSVGRAARRGCGRLRFQKNGTIGKSPGNDHEDDIGQGSTDLVVRADMPKTL